MNSSASPFSTPDEPRVEREAKLLSWYIGVNVTRLRIASDLSVQELAAKSLLCTPDRIREIEYREAEEVRLAELWDLGNCLPGGVLAISNGFRVEVDRTAIADATAIVDDGKVEHRVARQLGQAMDRAGLNVGSTSSRSEIKSDAVVSILRGERNPLANELLRLAGVTGVTVDFLTQGPPANLS